MDNRSGRQYITQMDAKRMVAAAERDEALSDIWHELKESLLQPDQDPLILQYATFTDFYRFVRSGRI